MEKTILLISDCHAPHQHKDTLDFLKAIKKKYSPISRVISLGDEVDGHSWSFHSHSPDLASAGHELENAKKFLKELEKLFPKMDILESNHGSLIYRKALAYGLPRGFFKSYNDYLEVGKGWKWHEDLIVKASNGQEIYLCHGKTTNIMKLGQQYGMNVVQGHYHTKFAIQYWGNPNALHWGLQAGCLIDKDSLAHEYNKLFKDRPIIGTGIIIDGLPKLLPMVLNKGGRWNKVVP